MATLQLTRRARITLLRALSPPGTCRKGAHAMTRVKHAHRRRQTRFVTRDGRHGVALRQAIKQAGALPSTFRIWLSSTMHPFSAYNSLLLLPSLPSNMPAFSPVPSHLYHPLAIYGPSSPLPFISASTHAPLHAHPPSPTSTFTGLVGGVVPPGW